MDERAAAPIGRSGPCARWRWRCRCWRTSGDRAWRRARTPAGCAANARTTPAARFARDGRSDPRFPACVGGCRSQTSRDVARPPSDAMTAETASSGFNGIPPTAAGPASCSLRAKSSVPGKGVNITNCAKATPTLIRGPRTRQDFLASTAHVFRGDVTAPPRARADPRARRTAVRRRRASFRSAISRSRRSPGRRRAQG